MPGDFRSQRGDGNAADADLPHGLTRSVPELPACTNASVQLLRYDGRHLDFDVTCAADGWLLVTDRWAPGWRAWVNQRPAKVWMGNLVFRAVPVARGENQVRFLYCPFGYPWLLVGSWGTLALVSVGSLWAGVRRRQPEQDKENG